MKAFLVALLCTIAITVTITPAQPAQPAQPIRQQTPALPPGDDSLYDIRDDVMIRTPDGATLSAIVIRQKGAAPRQPAVFTLDIYTNPDRAKQNGKAWAARGYVSVLADVRGKRLSPDNVVLYERDGEDSYAVIDWISRQSWSNGKVGIVGGSFSGFSAWAATKRMHPALKTIAVSAAQNPGYGLPMMNNIFLTPNYGWVQYTTNNKYLDDETYNDNARWQNLIRNWFASGRPYREIDQVDGKPNPWLQRWLQHPAYDAFWQAMVPYKQEFSKINIPVLTITGYYDDGQGSALDYLKQHTMYNRKADHYLVIGPYDHFGTHAAVKPSVLRDYAIDPVAQLNSVELKFQWMDWILKGGPKPSMLTDRVNYEVMGANEWRHVPSVEKMHGKPQRLWFTNVSTTDRYRLDARKPVSPAFLEQTVDFTNRRIYHNYNAYPSPIIRDSFRFITEMMFITEPFEKPTVVAGPFSGELNITINKKDVDLGVTVFEVMPDGKFFHLGYWTGRASFARDGSRRVLLTPDRPTRIPFTTSFTGRKMSAGSRLFVMLDVNKNPGAQVNYGTGKDVSDESVADAGEPLRVKWHNDSYVDIPLSD